MYIYIYKYYLYIIIHIHSVKCTVDPCRCLAVPRTQHVVRGKRCLSRKTYGDRVWGSSTGLDLGWFCTRSTLVAEPLNKGQVHVGCLGILGIGCHTARPGVEPWGQSGQTPAAASGAHSMPASQLPWAQIPSFVAGETNLEDFAKKLSFLASIWPEEHIQHLGPRVVLQCDSIAFKNKIPTTKLKSKEGCTAILEALGVQWGRFQTEDRYLKFERAIFSTQQKMDESNDSYIARHEACFEDLLQKDKKVTLEEVQSY